MTRFRRRPWPESTDGLPEAPPGRCAKDGNTANGMLQEKQPIRGTGKGAVMGAIVHRNPGERALPLGVHLAEHRLRER
jgi:hypothetical protein